MVKRLMEADFNPDNKNKYELADLKIRAGRLFEKVNNFFMVHEDFAAMDILNACLRLERVCQKFMGMLPKVENSEYSIMEALAEARPKSTPIREDPPPYIHPIPYINPLPFMNPLPNPKLNQTYTQHAGKILYFFRFAAITKKFCLKTGNQINQTFTKPTGKI